MFTRFYNCSISLNILFSPRSWVKCSTTQPTIESGKYTSPEEIIVDALKMFATKAHIETPVQVKTPEELGWPPGFFEQTAGCLEDDPLVRYPQGDYEMREPLE